MIINMIVIIWYLVIYLLEGMSDMRKSLLANKGASFQKLYE